jgi:hypothetical protein
MEPQDILKVKSALAKAVSCVTECTKCNRVSPRSIITADLLEHAEYICIRPRYFPLSPPKTHHVHYEAHEIKVNPASLALLCGSYD